MTDREKVGLVGVVFVVLPLVLAVRGEMGAAFFMLLAGGLALAVGAGLRG
jgi:uncharacterized membrane protein YdfJ with MMPL/SSD domain